MADREAERQKRLRDALRENLKRRKSQARRRNDDLRPSPDLEPDGNGEFDGTVPPTQRNM